MFWYCVIVIVNSSRYNDIASRISPRHYGVVIGSPAAAPAYREERAKLMCSVSSNKLFWRRRHRRRAVWPSRIVAMAKSPAGKSVEK